MKKPYRNSLFLFGFSKPLMTGIGLMLFVVVLISGRTQAFQFKTDNPDLRVRFDNTITYSAVYRLGDQDAALIADPNTDDGDRNFDKGIVMNRMDLLSELDVVYKKFGVRFSGAAWYDTVYNTSNDNDSPFTANPLSVPHNEFTNATRDLHGRKAELLEAFTFGAFDIGETTLRYRAGQFTQWWGESFFLGANGIASGLAPVDIAKAATLPNTQLKELIIPIPQVSVDLQVTDNLAFGGYYQFKWEPARFFASGSYFSPADILGDGAERIIAGPDANFIKTSDVEPDDSGQYGFKVKYDTMAATFGAYYLKYHSKDFIPTTVLDVLFPPAVPEPTPIPYQYYMYYPEDIEAYGVSANMAVGYFTYAIEVTYRENAPLAAAKEEDGPTSIPAFGVVPRYPRGKTLHVNINTFSPGLPQNFFSDSQDLIIELGWNKCLSVEENEDMVDPAADDEGLVAQFVYEPKWFQVLPGLELHLPIGANYGFKGKSKAVPAGLPGHHSGDFNIGIYGLYNNVWEAAITYRNYFGNNPAYQPHGDRDYVSFYIRRSF